MKERKAADERSGHRGAASLPQSPLYKLYPAALRIRISGTTLTAGCHAYAWNTAMLASRKR